MKKLVAAAAVLVALLVFAPWGIGKLAERHVNGGLEHALEQMPYFAVAERKYTPGWFSSEQVLTFELRNPWLEMMQEAMVGKQASADDEEDGSVEDAALEDGSAEAAAEAAIDSTPAAFQAPRFTVRNKIQHGPVLWPFGFGAARVKTEFEWSDEVRQSMIKAFGDDEPFSIVSRVGFFGGGTTTLSSDARTLEPEDGTEISWDDFEFDIHYSRDASNISYEGEWPRFEVRSKDGTHFVLRDFEAEGKGERIVGSLFDSDGVFEVDSIRVNGPSESFEMNDLEYVVDTSRNGDFLDMSAKFGSGTVKAKQLTLNEVHYDVSLRHLHTASLDKVMETIKQSYVRALAGESSEISLGMNDEEKQTIFALLDHDPVFAIDRISLATQSGDGVIKGVFRFNGVTEADFQMGGLGLLSKLVAEIDIDFAEALITEFGGDSSAVDMVVGEGYAVRKEGRVASHIEFKAGELTINGKTQAIPGLGAPPSQDADAMAGPE